MTLWLISIKPPILGIFSVDRYSCTLSIRRIFPKVVNYQVSIGQLSLPQEQPFLLWHLVDLWPVQREKLAAQNKDEKLLFTVS